MAKAAKKPAAKAAVKATSSKKPAKKAAAPKKAASPKAKKETKLEKPVSMEASVEPVAEPMKVSKKEKAARAAQEKVNAEEFKKWSDLRDKHGSEKALTYSMSASFESSGPLIHKILGWGYILSNQNDRLEVLFESGPKMLISNYKPR